MFSFKRGAGCILIGLLLLSSPAFAEDTATAVLEIPQAEHNFGEVEEGAKVEHDFVIKNSGTADLQITRVISGCGCTAVAAINTAIAPGTETPLKVTFDTFGMSGQQSKSVRIYSNDPKSPIKTVSLSGVVKKSYSVEPASVYFDSLVKGQEDNLRQRVSVKLHDPKARISDIKSHSKHILIENAQGSDQEKSFEIALDSNLPVGDFRDRVMVTLAGSSTQIINIPVYANIKGNLELDPPAVSFGIIVGKDTVTRKVRVSNHSAQPFVLNSVETDSAAIKTRVIEEKPGKAYIVEIKLDPAKVDKDLRAQLVFKAETELEELLTMNVYGVLPPKL